MKWKLPILSIVTVVLFFIIVELLLWLIGVPTLVSERDPFLGFSRQVRVFQPDRERDLYLTPQRAVLHSFNYQEFKIDKPENGFRIFVFGGSSAYGFPWGARVAFPFLLEEGLKASFPDRFIEVINASAMSYGSHRLRILIREILDYKPDLIIIYGGHNEFVERRFYRDLLKRPEELDRARLLLHRWRLYSLMTRAYRKVARKDEKQERGADAGKRTMGELLGLDVSREHSVDVTDAEKAEAHRSFEENLNDILDQAERAHLPVIVCTLPSNLTGWRPNQSIFTSDVSFDDRRMVQRLLEEAQQAFDKNDAASATEKLSSACSLAPSYAEAQFLLGKAYEQIGRFKDAKTAFTRARDDDAKPTRADSAINGIIRRCALRKNVLLMDIEQRFAEASPHGLIGFDLIQDYVHPNKEGHRLIALELWKALLSNGLLGESCAADPAEFWRAAGAKSTPKVVAGADAAALLYNMAVILENQEHIDQAIEKYRECRDLDPGHFVEASAGIGRLLFQSKRYAEATEEYRKALEKDPEHMKSLMGYAESLRQIGHNDEARNVYARATSVDPGNAIAWNRLGVSFAEQSRYTEAESAFSRAVSLDPENAQYLSDLGFVLLFQGKVSEAESTFRKSIGVQSDDRRAWNGLAAVLTEQGRLGEAAVIFRESLRIDPDDASARSGLTIIDNLQKNGQ